MRTGILKDTGTQGKIKRGIETGMKIAAMAAMAQGRLGSRRRAALPSRRRVRGSGQVDQAVEKASKVARSRSVVQSRTTEGVMGGGPLYNPEAYEGGGRGPVSPGVAKAGYLTTAIGALEQGYQQKRQRQAQALTTRAQIAEQNLQKAQSNLKQYGSDPNLANQFKQEEAQALAENDKIQKELQKHFGADKTIWGALWDKITKGQGRTRTTAGRQLQPPVPKSAPKPTAGKVSGYSGVCSWEGRLFGDGES